MMFRKIYAIITFTLFTLTATASKHVLLIGIDGARRDSFNLALTEIRQAQQDNFLTHVFLDEGAFDDAIESGRDSVDGNKQFTFSEPGWVSILTGVWAYHHNIHFNSDLEKGSYNHAYPTIYNYIKQFVPAATTASFTDWKPISVFAGYSYYGNDAADINRYFSYTGDAELPAVDVKMTDEIIQLIQSAPPTFIFVHYDNPDTAGHAQGFSSDVPEYMTALKQELTNVDRLVAAVPDTDEWFVILTTDHGGHGISHGGLTAEDRDIFAVLHAPGTRYSGGISLPIDTGLVTFVPTILDFLSATGGYDKLDGGSLKQFLKL